MAQHIPISAFKQKAFRRIEAGIRKWFQGLVYLRTSNFWTYIDDQEGNEVYIHDYYVGKGFVWGDTRACFEVHYNRREKNIKHIFMVA
jgi:hypothetical protein